MRKRMSVILGLIALSVWCGSCQEEQAQEGVQVATTTEVEKETKVEEVVSELLTDATVLAHVKDRMVTGGELRQAYIQTMFTGDSDTVPRAQALTLEEVLQQEVADIVLVLDARQQNLLAQDSGVLRAIEKFKVQQIVNKYVYDHILPLVDANEAEVKAAMAGKTKLTAEQARVMVKNKKARQVLQDVYRELTQKRHAQVQDEALAKVAKIHERLLRKPEKPRSQTWILNRQIQEELTEEEKALVLVTFDNGQYTALDWFYALGEVSPPGRPRNLSTPEGVKDFMNRSLMTTILTAEAISLGVDQDPQVLAEIRRYEDMRYENKVNSRTQGQAPDPTEPEVMAYYEKIKDRLQQRHKLMALTIWSPDRASAEAVAEKARSGTDFAGLMAEHSLTPDVNTPATLMMHSEGIYWSEIWAAAEPNAIVGPVVGLFAPQRQTAPTLKWRVLKIVSKEVGESVELSDYTKEMIKYRIKTDWVERKKRETAQALLADYEHEIRTDILSHFDPRQVP